MSYSRYPPANPSVYPNTSGYSYPSALRMTPQGSDSGSSSGIPSPESPRGRYLPATSNDVYDEPKSSKPKPAFQCLYPRCEAAFTRPFDLSRHQKTFHRISVRIIDCPEGWCGRCGQPEGREKGGFSRSDHFYEHVKKVHRKEVVRDNGGNMWVKGNDGRLCKVHVTGSSS